MPYIIFVGCLISATSLSNKKDSLHTISRQILPIYKVSPFSFDLYLLNTSKTGKEVHMRSSLHNDSVRALENLKETTNLIVFPSSRLLLKKLSFFAKIFKEIYCDIKQHV